MNHQPAQPLDGALPPELEQPTALAALATRSAAWFEHWFPDAFAFAVLTVAAVFLMGLGVGRSAVQMAGYFGEGFWKMMEFTMQMVMIVVTGHALATAPPVSRGIDRLAAHAGSGRRAVAFVGLFSMLSSLLSWSFSLIFSGLLARSVARRAEALSSEEALSSGGNSAAVDYRALGAAAYLGLGSIWALGLSSSAALLMATPSPTRLDLQRICGILPFSQTILCPQSLVMAAALLLLSLLVAWLTAPIGNSIKSAADCGVDLGDGTQDASPLPDSTSDTCPSPAMRLENSPFLTLIVVGVGTAYIGGHLIEHGLGALLDLPVYILVFLLAGLLLHWHPRSYTRAVVAATPAAAGLLLQYPLYSAAARMLTESGVTTRLAEFFVSHSSAQAFPLVVGLYSAVLGLFIPSAGGKWLIEAPYLMAAATRLHVHLGWVVQTYNAAEALPNLIHPFWMLPLLGILELKAKDVVGFTAVQFLVHVPAVLFLVWLLPQFLPYVPPMMVPVP